MARRLGGGGDGVGDGGVGQVTSSSSSYGLRKGIFLQNCFRRQRQCLQRQQREQQLFLRRLAHRERLALASRHNLLGYASILGGVGILLLLLVFLLMMLTTKTTTTRTARFEQSSSSWFRFWDSDSSSDSMALLLSWGFGMGMSCSFVLIFAESSRHFRWAAHVLAMDEELQEIDTVSTTEDDDAFHHHQQEQQEERPRNNDEESFHLVVVLVDENDKDDYDCNNGTCMV